MTAHGQFRARTVVRDRRPASLGRVPWTGTETATCARQATARRHRTARRASLAWTREVDGDLIGSTRRAPRGALRLGVVVLERDGRSSVLSTSVNFG